MSRAEARRAAKQKDDLEDEVQRTGLAAIAELERRHGGAARVKCEGSLAAFVREFWSAIEPVRPLLWNWHIDMICAHLERISFGTIRRLAVNIPPRYMKSNLITVMWPCWEWIHKPGQRWVFWSYSESLSFDHARKRLHVLTSEKYQRWWGKRVEITRTALEDTRNATLGQFISTSVGGTATGKGGDRLIIDDPLNPKQAASTADLKRCTDFWKETLPSRLDDKKLGAMVLVMQRLHEDDPTGLATKEGCWVHLCVPAEYDPETSMDTAIYRDPRTVKGALLWPEREGPTEIEAMKRSLGTFAYAAQYQQRPAPEGGGIFRREWFRYWHWESAAEHAIMYQGQRISLAAMFRFSTTDLAVDTKTSADWTVTHVYGLWRGIRFLLDISQDRLEAPDIVPNLLRLGQRYEIAVHYVEAIQYQLAIVQLALRAGLQAKAIRYDRDKMARAKATSPSVERGEYVFPAVHKHLGELEGQLLVVPNGTHDDHVDALSIAEIATRMNPGSVPPPPMRSSVPIVSVPAGFAAEAPAFNGFGADAPRRW